MATPADVLRLLAVPVLAWAAWRDHRTRRVPNRIWGPLVVVALIALGLDIVRVVGEPVYITRSFAIRSAISIGFLIPIAYVFWWLGGFGGADAKALMVLAVLFPIYPTYELAGVFVPLSVPPLGVFSLSVLTNAVIVGLAYPLTLAGRNLLDGEFGVPMFIGRRVQWADLLTTHGRLLETPAGFTRTGLDLDALRMYLRWRGLSLRAIRDHPEQARDPATLPADPNPPTDGAVGTTPAEDDEHVAFDETTSDRSSADDYADPWGAERFLDSIDGTAYGTTPSQLRQALDLLADTDTDEIWVSPGIPFLIPLFVGLLVTLVYGDLLHTLITLIGGL
ncbi:MAG: A24 family peptidase C-terminal domain-containing protein [Halobacteriales archaeon]